MAAIDCCRYEDFVKALANETRQRILDLLQDREMSVGEIVACFSLAQSTISQHLAVLRRAGLVQVRQDGQQSYYTVNRYCLQNCCQLLISRLAGPEDRAREGS